MKSCLRSPNRSGHEVRKTNHAFPPRNRQKKPNRKPIAINHLADLRHASARSPTARFCTENKSTPKLNGIDPEAYLRYVITHINEHRVNQVAGLLPWNVAAQLPRFTQDETATAAVPA